MTVILGRKGAPPSDVKKTTSDSAGDYRFASVAAGTYTLTASSGAAIATTQLTIKAGDLVTVDLKMT